MAPKNKVRFMKKTMITTLIVYLLSCTFAMTLSKYTTRTVYDNCPAGSNVTQAVTNIVTERATGKITAMSGIDCDGEPWTWKAKIGSITNQSDTINININGNGINVSYSLPCSYVILNINDLMLVNTANYTTYTGPVDISGLTPGEYYVIVLGADGSTESIGFLK